MGQILSTKFTGKTVVFEVEIDNNEATSLKGYYDDIHLFTEKVSQFDTNISSRGKNSVTKYFLIPRYLRKNVDFQNQVKCQIIENSNKVIFIYVVDKNVNKSK